MTTTHEHEWRPELVEYEHQQGGVFYVRHCSGCSSVKGANGLTYGNQVLASKAQSTLTHRKTRPGDQQLPVRNTRHPIQRMVIADIEKRIEVGIERYGTPLQAFNGRNPVQDAYEETIDLAQYLKQIMVEASEILRLTVAAEGGRQFLDKKGHLRSLSLLARISGDPEWSFLILDGVQEN